MAWHPNHPPCDCGCGELADECAGPRPNPLGSMRLTTTAENGLRNVRAAIRTRPGTHDTDPDPTRARAIARARQDRTNAKEAQP